MPDSVPYPPQIPLRIDVITLFPQIFDSYLGESLLSKAITAGLMQVHLHDMARNVDPSRTYR
jgi:tRNA G37 N-methylase TrmD